jgi:hypothetical protein
VCHPCDVPLRLGIGIGWVEPAVAVEGPPSVPTDIAHMSETVSDFEFETLRMRSLVLLIFSFTLKTGDINGDRYLCLVLVLNCGEVVDEVDSVRVVV